jgi:hypothetical protein
MSHVFVGTDVGVFGSPTSAPNWTELGPNPSTNQAGFLPNVAVTALGVFASGGQQLLRASTYGRGMWQFDLVIAPDFQVAVTNPQQTVFGAETGTFNGTISGERIYEFGEHQLRRGSDKPTQHLFADSVEPHSRFENAVHRGGRWGNWRLQL